MSSAKKKIYAKLYDNDDQVFNHASHLDNEDIKSICCFNSNAFVLLSNGQVYAAGKNKHGELGLSHNSSVSVFTIIPNLPPIKCISTGSLKSTIAISQCGTQIYLWGAHNKSTVPKLYTIGDAQYIFTECFMQEAALVFTQCGKVFSIGRNSYGSLLLKDTSVLGNDSSASASSDKFVECAPEVSKYTILDFAMLSTLVKDRATGEINVISGAVNNSDVKRESFGTKLVEPLKSFAAQNIDQARVIGSGFIQTTLWFHTQANNEIYQLSFFGESCLEPFGPDFSQEDPDLVDQLKERFQTARQLKLRNLTSIPNKFKSFCINGESKLWLVTEDGRVLRLELERYGSDDDEDSYAPNPYLMAQNWTEEEELTNLPKNVSSIYGDGGSMVVLVVEEKQ